MKAAASQTSVVRLPPRHVVLSPSAFADDWGSRPDADVAIGVRFISVEDMEVARNVAVRKAREWLAPKGQLLDEQAFDHAYNDELLLGIVARATCDPNDVSKPYFKCAEDTIRLALTSDGVRRIWDELCLLHAGSGVAMPQASDEDTRELAAILMRGVALDKAPADVRVEAKKMVSYLLERLRPLDDGTPMEATIEFDDEDSDRGVVVATGTLG